VGLLGRHWCRTSLGDQRAPGINRSIASGQLPARCDGDASIRAIDNPLTKDRRST
jgi:hypothetical protein